MVQLFKFLILLLFMAPEAVRAKKQHIASTKPTTENLRAAGGAAKQQKNGLNFIFYRLGAKVLTGNVDLYLIYYGTWADSEKQLIETFANGIGTSGWYNTTKQYYFQQNQNSGKIMVNGTVKVKQTVTDTGSLGFTLGATDIAKIVNGNINNDTFPADTNAIYYVLTSDNVKESMDSSNRFCTNYCGYHGSTIANKNNTRVQYSMVGKPPPSCFGACAASLNSKVSPNSNVAVDALLSVFAHELTEAVTDPYGDMSGKEAWYDQKGYENGDKCSWNFGTVKKDTFGASYNVEISNKKWLVQLNWSPVSQSCVLKTN